MKKDKINTKKSFDFSSYYKTAAETIKSLENDKNTKDVKENRLKVKNKYGSTTKSSRLVNKNCNKFDDVDISHIDIDGSMLDGNATVTSTPRDSQKFQVKSIMKISTSLHEDFNNDAPYSPGKPKKRNKSVSFMLDDTDELSVKKTKSNETINLNSAIDNYKKIKKSKKQVRGKENFANPHVKAAGDSVDPPIPGKDASSKNSKDKYKLNPEPSSIQNSETITVEKKRKLKNYKKQTSKVETVSDKETQDVIKQKKNKVKNPKLPEKRDSDGETTSKSYKKDVKQEAIVQNLENLSIGDNPHTLTNLLDEMSVAEKDKRKKNKRKLKKDKKTTPSTPSSEIEEENNGEGKEKKRKLKKDKKTTPSTPSSEIEEENNEEGKEKIKWKKRKWNKDKKGGTNEDVAETTVIVDNLPLSILCTYKKLLAEHFGKYGLIKKVGIAEFYPTEKSEPVFSTTILFYSDGAASKALEEHNTKLEGSRIRVIPALPPTLTTLVVRSFGSLTEHVLSATFAPAGRVREIRHLVKGKKSIGTAFIVFDSAEAVDRALVLARTERIDGKKMHCTRFEIRTKKHKNKKSSQDEENKADSDASIE